MKWLWIWYELNQWNSYLMEHIGKGNQEEDNWPSLRADPTTSYLINLTWNGLLSIVTMFFTLCLISHFVPSSCLKKRCTPLRLCWKSSTTDHLAENQWWVSAQLTVWSSSAVIHTALTMMSACQPEVFSLIFIIYQIYTSLAPNRSDSLWLFFLLKF